MSKLFRKVLASFLIGIVLTISIAPAVKAQASPWYSQDFGSWYAKVYDTSNPQEIFGERYTAAQVQWVFWGVLAFMINLASGNNPAVSGCIAASITGNATPCIQPIIDSQKNLNSQFKIGDSGRSENLGQMIFEDRSLSGVTYVKEVERRFHIVPEAKAQGFGYTGALGVIPDIQNAWKVMRNLSYTLFVIVILVFAFMIMFRIKISPQVVITVQSALPKIALGLILVTFSYAIAGFLIDMMYVVMGLLSVIFSQFTVFGVSFSGLAGTGVGATTSTTGYFTLLTQGPTFLGVKTGVFGLMIMYFINYFLAWIFIVMGGIVTGLLGSGGFVGGSIVAVLTFFLGLLGLIVVFITAIINFFKIIILLVKTFLSIILLTIFAPLQLTVGMIVPGLSFGGWVRSYISKLAVFPAVGVMFILALWFLQLAWGTVPNSPTFFGGGNTNFAQGWPPLLGGSPQMVALAFLLVSIAIFAMIPKVGDMVESLIAGKPFNFGSAIGEVTNPLGIRTFGTGIAKEAFGTYIGNQLYNPREGSGFVPETITRIRTGLGKRGGTAGGPPTA